MVGIEHAIVIGLLDDRKIFKKHFISSIFFVIAVIYERVLDTYV